MLGYHHVLLGQQKEEADYTLFKIVVSITTAGTEFEFSATGTNAFTIDWGDNSSEYVTTTSPTHTYAAIGDYTISVYGTMTKIYFYGNTNAALVTELLQIGDTSLDTDQGFAFDGCTLDSLPNDSYSLAFFNSLTSAISMFADNSITEIPEGITFEALITGNNMFVNNNITTLASTMLLNNLTSGISMFYSNSIGAIPDSMLLSKLTNGYRMFGLCSILTLPEEMYLPELESGLQMFISNTINTDDYSQLLINLYVNSNTSVNFHGGSSKYDSTPRLIPGSIDIYWTPAQAKSYLEGAFSWTFTDGGLE